MSKLEKAMERAKQARGTVTSPAGAATIPSPVNKGRRSEPIDPVYTQTRVYPFDEALLEKHGVLTTAFDSIIVEQYNLLRARVMEAMTSNGYNSICQFIATLAFPRARDSMNTSPRERPCLNS
jgi:hypothetical protein